MGTSNRGEAKRKGLLLAAALLGAAVVQELRRPREERTWTGDLVMRIPYDLRTPTRERVLRSVWAPDDPRIVVPRAFGVGWSVNFARLVGRRPESGA